MIRKIPVDDLTLGMYVHELHGSWLHHPFWKTRFLLDDPQDLAKIKSCGIKEVSIDFSLSRLSAPAQAKPADPETNAGSSESSAQVPQSSLSAELKRARQLCEYSKTAVVEMFKEARMGNTVAMEQARDVVEQISSSVSRNPQALITLARLKTSDNYTYMHSVAVCAMMVALARELGLSDAEVKEAGAAGLLHDVGKMAVPDSILNKPGKLSDDEFRIIQTHPERGAEILVRSGGVSPVVIDVCLHHHEKYDGTGYPHGLNSDVISRMARMGAICDVYDAVTSNRSYKKGWGPAESLQRMASWKGHFDPSYFQAFVKVVGIYPVGSLVRLKSQRLAVVLEQNEKSLVKPKVKVFFSARSNMPLPQTIIDLSLSGMDDSIEAREPSENWNFPYLDELWQSGI